MPYDREKKEALKKKTKASLSKIREEQLCGIHGLATHIGEKELRCASEPEGSKVLLWS